MGIKINFNKEMLRTVGKAAGTVGKAIVIEGVKGVLLKSATAAITTSFDSGIQGVKQLSLNEYVTGKKDKREKVPVIKVKEQGGEFIIDKEDFKEALSLEVGTEKPKVKRNEK